MGHAWRPPWRLVAAFAMERAHLLRAEHPVEHAHVVERAMKEEELLGRAFPANIDRLIGAGVQGVLDARLELAVDVQAVGAPVEYRGGMKPRAGRDDMARRGIARVRHPVPDNVPAENAQLKDPPGL